MASRKFTAAALQQLRDAKKGEGGSNDCAWTERHNDSLLVV